MTAAPSLTSAAEATPPEVTDGAVLLRPVRRVLTATVGAADLLTLELQVCGVPPLSLLVQSRTAHAAQGLAVWPTTLAPCAGHDGLLLVATAVRSDAARRAAVHSAAMLIGDLLTAERRRLEAEAAARRAVELAGVDPLTGLGNLRTWRRALEEEAARAARYDRDTAVVVVDLDGLKQVNDEHGHAAGDDHLRRAAAALRAGSRAVDVVCRLGGDEFAVLAPETGPEGASHLAARLRAQLAAAGVRASLGVATAADADLERTWHAADAQMYLDKRRR